MPNLNIGALRYKAIGRDRIIYDIRYPVFRGWDMSIENMKAAGVWFKLGRHR